MRRSPIPRSRPSAQGVDARGLVALLDGAEAAGLELHSLMVLRHGAVVAEGWWAPYRRDDRQLVYSLSKTFTAMAIGIAVGDGLLNVDDLVADLLPDDVPQPLPAHLRTLRVRHLLSMASGHRADTIFAISAARSDPVQTFLATEPEDDPGATFAYNQGNPIALSAILTRLTGERLVDYLGPRLFEPLGIDGAEWLALSPALDQGFSGLHVDTEAIAKLGQLLLQGGVWNGTQLVPADFVAACRRPHIANAEQSTEPDWQQGYGYLTWMCRHDAQRGDGAYGQLCVVLPDHDAVVAVTAELLDMQAELNLVWDHLLPAFTPGAPGQIPRVGVDEVAEEELAVRLSTLRLPTIEASAAGPARVVEAQPSGSGTFFLGNLDRVRVEPLPGRSGDPAEPACRLVLTISGVEHAFELRRREWGDGLLPDLHTPYPEAAASGGWVTDHELRADIVSRRTPHRLQIRLRTGSEDDDASNDLSVRWRLPPLPIPTFDRP